MLATKVGDPRLESVFGVSEPLRESVRPMMRLPRQAVPPALLVVAAAILAATLFLILNERRLRREEPAIRPSQLDASAKSWPEPPPLLILPAEQSTAPVPLLPSAIPAFALPSSQPVAPGKAQDQSRTSVAPLPRIGRPQAVFVPPQSPFVTGQPRGGAPLLIDGEASGRPPFSGGVRTSESPSTERVRASMLANPSLTVAQGSLIPAVLETGFDSTKPGFARAIVSRDVRGFDGKNVLIPRGSRLVGESSSSVSDGQQRAEIRWSRLVRPDGTTIGLDSPTTDPAGRSGVPASVNTHLLARVGDVIATTIGSLGQILAARASPFIILPGSVASAAPRVAAHSKHVPTLKVAPGTSISVFVAHDLEFSTPEDRR